MPVKKKERTVEEMEKQKRNIIEFQKQLETLLKKQNTELVTQTLLTHGELPVMSIVLRFKPEKK